VNTFLTLYAAPPELTAHAPALMIVGPLMAACAAALAPGPRWAWAISIGGSAFAFWMVLCVAGEVARTGVVSYAMGGFAPPLGIELRIDALGVLIALVIAGSGALAAVFSRRSLEGDVRPAKRGLFQAGFLLCLAGLLGMGATGDAFNAFVFLEVSSIGTYALIAMGVHRDRRALPAAFNYLILGTVGATFFVVGVGFLYGATGTLNMADMAARLKTLHGDRAVEAGFAFIVVGLGLKAAMFPLHAWLPGAYAYAPSLVNVFLSATATKAAIYLMVRFIFTVFGGAEGFVGVFLHWVLAPLAVVAAVLCSLQALAQSEVRRVLAFSSVAQVGYMLLGVAMGTTAGLAAGLFHLFNHATMKSALFMAIGGLALHVKATRLSDFAGMGRQAPWTMTAFAIAALSLIGVPLTDGFLSKWKLFEATMAAGWTWAVIGLAASSLIAIVYVGRMLETMFFRAPAPDAVAAREAPFSVLAPLWALAAMNVWFGLDASLPLGLAEAAARAVTGAAP
jgi:multicomponent Na+:H+ antiporter subunit D